MLTPTLAAPALAQEETAPEAAPEEGGALPEIVVYGAARGPRALLETPNAASVIGSEEIAETQPSTYADLLQDATGVLIEGGPRGISQEPNIRGFQDEQIVLRVDGARQNFNAGHRGRFFVDPAALKRVEIIRGGASTMYGSGALGGVISLETKDAADVVAPGQDYGGEISLGYNSQGDEIFTNIALGGFFGDFEALGFLSYRPMFSDLKDGDGEAINDSRIDAGSALLKLAYAPVGPLRIEASYLRYQDDGETPPNANAASSADTVVDRDISKQSGRVELSYAPDGSETVDLTALAYVDATELTEDRFADGRYDETRLTTIGVEAVNRSRVELGLPVRLSYGIEAFQDAQEAERDGAARPQSPDAERRFLAGFAQAELALTERLALIPGLRYDYFELDPETAYESRSDGELSPRIALNWRPTDSWQLYASAAQSFRAPSLTELYADGVHFSVDGFSLDPGVVFTGVNAFQPAPDLEPEVAQQVEIGARFLRDGVASPRDRLSFSANVYAANVENYIDQVVTFIDFDTATFNPVTGNLEVSGSTVTRNVDAELWGFEADLTYDAGPWFMGAGVTLPRGREADGGALGSIPGDKLTAKLGVRPMEALTLGARATFADGQDDVPEEGTPADGYVVFDLYTTYAPYEQLTLRAGVDNVADRTYRVHPNGLNDPGRSFKIGASVEF